VRNAPFGKDIRTSALIVFLSVQHQTILERTLPEALKLSIAKKIENNLFSKVKLPSQL
jgi:hypothetical protein